MKTMFTVGLAVTLIQLLPTLLSAQTRAQKRTQGTTPTQMRCGVGGVSTAAGRRFSALRIGGEDNRARTERVTKELTWHSSLNPAFRAARRKGRPIVYIQALGDITGYC